MIAGNKPVVTKSSRLFVSIAVGATTLVALTALTSMIDEGKLSQLNAGAEFVAVVAGFPAAIFALVNYAMDVSEKRRANLWRRREFVHEQIVRIEAVAEVRAAMTMLDYWDRPVLLPGAHGPVKVTNAMLTKALSPGATKLVAAEVRIRDSFDGFFDAMDRLGGMRDAGLITVEDLAPYISYWLELLASAPRNRNPEFGAVVRRYIHKYHFEALERLMTDLGVATFREADETVAQHYSRQRGRDS